MIKRKLSIEEINQWRLMSKDMETVSLPTRYGPITVPVTDTIIGRALAKYGEWAQLEIEALAHFIKDGDTVLDVGACFGTHSLAFSELVGASGRVIAFEASPTNFALLQRNCSDARGAVIELMQAVVAKGDEARFVVRDNEENRGGSWLERSSARDSLAAAGAGQISLSIDSLALGRVDFIKIDVEGMESDVVSGAMETLHRFAPIVFFEVNSIQGGLKTLDVMKESPYFFFGLVSQTFNPANFLEVADDIFVGGCECGILAVPKSRYGETRDAIRNLGMAAMVTADDVALLLLNKPQYAAWDITRERAARTLKVPAIVASVGGVGQIRRELEALRSEKMAFEAKKSLEKSAVEQLLAQSNAEKSAVENKLELIGRELADQQRNLDQLNSLLLMAQRLARRASKFPFSIYFRAKRKYRIILRSLLRDAVLTARGGLPADTSKSSNESAPPIEPTAAPVADSGAAATPRIEPHPGGFKAERLTYLHRLTPPEILKAEDVRYGEERLLSAKVIHDVLAKQAKAANSRSVILSFSHDHYATIAGGTQLCVGIEEQEARADGHDYLHIHPLPVLQSLAPVNVADLPFLRLTLNGAVIGICSYDALRNAARQFRMDGIEQFVVIHHLLGHSVESIGEIIEATGRRRCWFWLHDFFTLCVNPHLLRNTVSFCGAPKPDSSGCGICAFGEARLSHLQRISSFFQENEVHLIAPSDFVADLWRERANLPYAALTIKPHVEIEWTAARSDANPVDRPARVAFVGVPAFHKGWSNFQKLVEQYRQNKDYDFLYFGVQPIDLDIPHFAVTVSKDDKSAMIDALREAGVDIVLHVSPTPETFSISTHEALASGAFVVTNAGSGNAARVIARTGRGLVLDHESDIDVAFARRDVLRLAEKARKLRAAEESKVIFSKMTIPFLSAESR